MSSGQYDQYPRPGDPRVPDLWEQPSFSPDEAELAAVVHAESTPEESPPVPAPARVDLMGPVRMWGQLAGTSAMLTVMLTLSATATQLTPLFAAAILTGISAAASAAKAVRAAGPLLRGIPGSHEDNG